MTAGGQTFPATLAIDISVHTTRFETTYPKLPTRSYIPSKMGLRRVYMAYTSGHGHMFDVPPRTRGEAGLKAKIMTATEQTFPAMLAIDICAYATRFGTTCPKPPIRIRGFGRSANLPHPCQNVGFGLPGAAETCMIS